MEETGKDKTWLLAAHLSGLASFVVPFGQIIGPLLVWQLKKSEAPAVGEQAKEALNFQITWTLLGLVFFALYFLAIVASMGGSGGAFGLGFLFLVPIVVVELSRIAITLWATIQGARGTEVRYPLTLRLVR